MALVPPDPNLLHYTTTPLHHQLPRVAHLDASENGVSTQQPYYHAYANLSVEESEHSSLPLMAGLLLRQAPARKRARKEVIHDKSLLLNLPGGE